MRLIDNFECLRWKKTGEEVIPCEELDSAIESKLITGEIYFGTMDLITRKTKGISFTGELDFSDLEPCYTDRR